MKIQVKDLKVNDIFTEYGYTVQVVNIDTDSYINGNETYRIETKLIDYNKKMFPKMNLGTTNFYCKKINTIINIK